MNKINILAGKNQVKDFLRLTPLSSTLYALRSNLLALSSSLFALFLSFAAEAAEPLPTAPGSVLESGHYTFSGMATVTASQPGQSALSVAPYATVFIELKNSATLELVGGNATTNQGAGAGLCVPTNSIVYIFGSGRLIAKGGNAASGADGKTGGTAKGSSKELTIGAGGAGGMGGGGAAAGIGGLGGPGGAGGAGGDIGDGGNHQTDTHQDSIFAKDGVNGGMGGTGGTGGGMGRVFVLGEVTIETVSGLRGETGSAGGYGGSWLYDRSGGNDYVASGGAGGGGGAGGSAATYGIGGGAAGGGGGGGGGSGAYYFYEDLSDRHGLNDNKFAVDSEYWRAGKGGCGNGVDGADGRETGVGHNNGYKDGAGGQATSKPGDGGRGGANGVQGTDGEFYVAPRAGVRDRTGWRYGKVPTPIAGDPYELGPTKFVFTSNYSNYFAKAGSTVILDGYFMNSLPDLTDALPLEQRCGYKFDGWWTTPSEAGTCYYGRDNVPRLPVVDSLGTVTLYARWTPHSNLLTVNTTEDTTDGGKLGGILGQPKISLRQAVQALADNAALTDTNGYRRITFDLPEESRVIKLESPIVVPAETKPFEINGLMGLKSVVLTSESSRILDVQGEGVSLRYLEFRASCATGAKETGGAVRCQPSGRGRLIVSDCAFFGNSADGGGGAIDTVAPALIANCTFAGNVAGQQGAALRFAADTVLVNCTFSENTGAGAVYRVSGGLKVVNCTFVGDATALTTTSFGDVSDVALVNCILANTATNGLMKNVAICTSATDPRTAFVNGGRPRTNELRAVRHVWYEPRHTAENFAAAKVRYDSPLCESLVALLPDGTTNVISGTAKEAKLPLICDQLRDVRLGPSRGAVRMVVGRALSTVTMEGVLTDKDGEPKANYQDDTAKAKVLYDDGEEWTAEVPLATDEHGFFGLEIPVDASDGTLHNVTGVCVQAVTGTNAPLQVSTVPYAFAAASATMLATGSGDEAQKDVVFPGDGVVASRMAAGNVSVASDLWLRAQGFRAGTVRDFGDTVIEGLDLRGGKLRILASSVSTKDSNEAEGTMTNETAVGQVYLYGRADALGKTSSAFTGAGGSPTEVLPFPFDNGAKRGAKDSGNDALVVCEAAGDGLLQLYVEAMALDGNRLGVSVSADGATKLVVTPPGRYWSDSQAGKLRKMLWTVPVQMNDAVTLTYELKKGSAMNYAVRLIPFGASQELVDVEKK